MKDAHQRVHGRHAVPGHRAATAAAHHFRGTARNGRPKRHDNKGRRRGKSEKARSGSSHCIAAYSATVPSDEEISAFEGHWPIGTRERTAFALFLYTGQRLGDVRRMSWRDVEGSTIKVIQGKTTAELWIPLHPGLSAALAAWPRAHMVMLTTRFGEPHSVKELGNWMAATIAQAGLPDRCVTHGLRKAAARRLAEAGYHRAPDHEHWDTKA
jgi:integrase